MQKVKQQLTMQDEMTQFLLYKGENGRIKVDVLVQDETVWLSIEQMAELFGVQRPAITKHLKNIFDDGELDKNVVSSILEHTTLHGAIEGKTQTQKVKYYNLDAVIKKKLKRCISTFEDPKTSGE